MAHCSSTVEASSRVTRIALYATAPIALTSVLHLSRRHVVPRLVTGVGVAVLSVTLVGCGLGQRPTLGPEHDPTRSISQQPVGIAAVDVVLEKLDRNLNLNFSATYSILPGSDKRRAVTATVVQIDGQSYVTIGDIRFLRASEEVTCLVSSGVCEPGIRLERVSDVVASGSGFYATATAQQLRVSTTRRRSDPIASTLAFAGIDSVCVAVPIGNGDEVYCVTPGGHLAYVERADVTIELTAVSDAVDPAALARPVAAA